MAAEQTRHAWREERRKLDLGLPGADEWGRHRGTYPFVEADGYRVRLLWVPWGQASPREADSVDRIIVGVDGDIEFQTNSTTFGVARYDLLTLPATTIYAYSNVGLEDALFCEITSRSRSASDVVALPVLLKWREQRRTLDRSYPDADLWGFHRGTYPRLSVREIGCNLVGQPPGQTTPWHGKPWDCVFLQLHGETLFETGGRQHVLEARDLLLVPAENPYRYSNVAEDIALFVSIAPTPAPGMKATYYGLRDR